MKQTLQITQSNFTVLVMELEEAVKNGYTLVKEGENRPYHAIMGNFIVTLEKEVDEEMCYPVSETVDGEPVVTEIPEKVVEAVVEVAVPATTHKPQHQRGPKPKK